MHVSGKCTKRELITPYMDCQIELSEIVVYLDYTHSRRRYIFHCGVSVITIRTMYYTLSMHVLQISN